MEDDIADAILANAEEALKKKSNAELDRNLKELRERFYFANDEVSQSRSKSE